MQFTVKTEAWLTSGEVSLWVTYSRPPKGFSVDHDGRLEWTTPSPAAVAQVGGGPLLMGFRNGESDEMTFRSTPGSSEIRLAVSDHPELASAVDWLAGFHRAALAVCDAYHLEEYNTRPAPDGYDYCDFTL